MTRTLRSAILVAAVTGGQCCDVNLLTTCEKDLGAVVGQGISAGKVALCKALTDYEVCFQTNSVGCAPAQVQAFKNVVTATRQQLTGNLGVDCLKASASTEPPLASGDSGSRSGSEPVRSSESSSSGSLKSSGSESASLPWQIAVLTICFLCCFAGIIGGAAYAMMKKSKPKNKKGPAREENYPEAQPLNRDAPEPIAQVAVDVDGDGRADYIATGVDMNNDGIPDALEGDRSAPVVIQEVAQPVQEVYAVETVPPLFGGVPQLMAGQVLTAPTTTSNYMPYGAYGTSYPATTSYAAPATTYPGYNPAMTSYAAGTTYAPTTYATGSVI